MTDPINQPVNPFTPEQREQAAQTAAIAEIRKRHIEQIIAVFANPQGLQLLDTWYDMFVSQPVVVMRAPEGHAQQREGENGFIRMIRGVVQRAQLPGPAAAQPLEAPAA